MLFVKFKVLFKYVPGKKNWIETGMVLQANAVVDEYSGASSLFKESF